jgi:SsrA-binding protein
MAKDTDDEKVLEANRQALHLFEIRERYEAGVALLGTEVKSLRAGGSSLRDAFARISQNEAFIYNWHISPYSHGNLENHEPLRTRKLLMRRSEIRKLIGTTRATGLTLVPLRVYLKNGRVKVELGLGRGRKVHDKREAIRTKEMKREAERARSTRGREE